MLIMGFGNKFNYERKSEIYASSRAYMKYKNDGNY